MNLREAIVKANGYLDQNHWKLTFHAVTFEGEKWITIYSEDREPTIHSLPPDEPIHELSDFD